MMRSKARCRRISIVVVLIVVNPIKAPDVRIGMVVPFGSRSALQRASTHGTPEH